MTISRRRSFAAATGLAAANLAEIPRTAPATDGGIRFGCITALTGPQEMPGCSILNSAQAAAGEVDADGGALGCLLQIIGAHAHADPRRCTELAREMASQGINLLCGCVTSDEALALTEILEPFVAALITCSAQSDKLTHEAFSPNFFRVTDQTIMRSHAQACLMAEHYPKVTRWGALLDAAKGPLTFHKEDHQAICDVDMIRIRRSSAPATMDILDYSRPDTEIAESMRYKGAKAMGPPTPGKALTYHA